MELGVLIVLKAKNIYMTRKHMTLAEAKIEMMTTKAGLHKQSIGKNRKAWFLPLSKVEGLPDVVDAEYLDDYAVRIK